jgi:hypothetical protein
VLYFIFFRDRRNDKPLEIHVQNGGKRVVMTCDTSNSALIYFKWHDIRLDYIDLSMWINYLYFLIKSE